MIWFRLFLSNFQDFLSLSYQSTNWMLLLVLIMATALLMSFGTTSPRYSIMQAMYFPGNRNHNHTYGFNLSAVNHSGTMEFMTFSEKITHWTKGCTKFFLNPHQLWDHRRPSGYSVQNRPQWAGQRCGTRDQPECWILSWLIRLRPFLIKVHIVRCNCMKAILSQINETLIPAIALDISKSAQEYIW